MRSTDKFEFKVDEDRFLFKLRFNLFLHQSIARLRAQGRRVVLLGDLNIALHPQDSCEPGDDFDSSPARAWMRSFLKDQQLVDAFRLFHALDKHKYTCWNQQTGARLTNYGTRIDYILVDESIARGTDGLRVIGCQVQGHEGPHDKGSDHCPVAAWLQVEQQTCPVLPSDRWWSLHMEEKGGDFDQARGNESERPQRLPPPLCATFLPEVPKVANACVNKGDV